MGSPVPRLRESPNRCFVKSRRKKANAKQPYTSTVKKPLWGLSKLEATSGAWFLIAQRCLLLRWSISACWGGSPCKQNRGTAPGTALGWYRNSHHLPPLLQGAPASGHNQSWVPLLTEPTEVIIININCGDGLPNSVQRGYYTAITLQQNVTTTDLGWFELMIQKWKALYPINSLPSNAKAHYSGLFVTRQERPNANPDLESIQRNSKRHPYNLSHRAKQQLQWGNTHFHGVLFTHVGEWWWEAIGETWRDTWTPTLQKPSAAPDLQGVNTRQLPSISALVSARPCFVLGWFAAGKRRMGLAVAGVPATVCTVGTGPSRYSPLPASCNPSPCWIWASRTLQLAQGHQNRTVPWHVSTQLPTLPPTQPLVQGVKLRYHSDNFMLLCKFKQ